MSRRVGNLALAIVLTAIVAAPAFAGIVVYEEGNKKIEIGGRVQMQYKSSDPEDGQSSDDVFFRRLRPYIAGTVTENWMGKIQLDFGKAEDDNEVAVKDAYLQWSGLKNLKLTIGNSKTPYSRGFLSSSKRLQVIERSFAGDHNYGSPDRQLGLRLDGHTSSRKLTWAANVGSQSHDPSSSKLDFDTPANQSSEWNEGYVVAGRVDFHPLGQVRFDQTDFQSDELKFNVSLAAYSWTNDDDNNTYIDPNTGASSSTTKADLDKATGVEVSAGLRGFGVSADVEYQMVEGESVDPSFAGGLYKEGDAELDILSAQAGYYLPVAPVEFVAGWDSLDAESYDKKWTRTSFGVNWFWNKHKAKIEAIFRKNENVDGVDGDDLDEVIVQTQFVF